MKLRIFAIITAVAFLIAPVAHCQTDNVIHVNQFPGSTVAAKVTAAMATCGTGPAPCYLIVDASLAPMNTGTMPAMCSNCQLVDYRSSWPGGNGLKISAAASTTVPMAPNSSGQMVPQTVIALIGNSKVQDDIGFLTEFCEETQTNLLGNQVSPLFFKDAQCRTSTAIAVDSSGNVTLTIPNADGYFYAGEPITAYGTSAVDSGCLFDSYRVASVSATQITFATAGSGETCGTLSSESASVLVSTSVVKFGENGATLSVWAADTTSNYGYGAWESWWQGMIAAARNPVTIWTDAGIAINSIREGGLSFQGFLSQLETVLSAAQTISATNPSGATETAAQTPMFITTGNPLACQTTTTGAATAPCSGGSDTGSGGVYVPPTQVSGNAQYVFPYGTSGAIYGTPATIISGAISAGTNTVTIDPCPPDLDGGPGDAETTVTDGSGNLLQDGNLVQMVFDTSGSGAQELVNVTGFALNSTVGLNGFHTCNVTFTNAFAHAANAQIVTTEFTADQTYTRWEQEIPYAIAALYPGNVKAIDSAQALGRQVIQPVVWIQNELHPGVSGYQLLAQVYLSFLSPYFSVPATPRNPSPMIYENDVEFLHPREPSLDLSYQWGATQAARVNSNGSSDAGAYYDKYAIDPSRFYFVTGGPLNQDFGSSYFFITEPLESGQSTGGDGQAGDSIYIPQAGSYQLQSFTQDGYFSSNVERFNFSGSKPNTPAVNSYDEALVMRPYFVDETLASYFLAHPMTYPLSGVLNVSVASGSTIDELILTMAQQQNPYVIGGGGLTCANVSVQQNDWLMVSGNAVGSYGTAGTLLQLGAGTWNPATCTWTDSSGTNYSTYVGYLANVVQQYRAPDASFSTISMKQALIGSYTVATLPDCAAGTKGLSGSVTDAISPTYLGALTGSGTVFTPVICNGSAWVSY